MANEYQTPPVYAPAATGVIHHAPRDRAEIDPDAKGGDRSVAKATEAPASQVVRKPDENAETGTKNSGSDGKPDLGPKTDPSNLVRAQEIAGDEKAEEPVPGQRRSFVASAAEMVGAPEELKRLDENSDGRIDQLELQHALRAKGDDTTYAALTHYQKTLGFGSQSKQSDDKFDAETAKADKMFAEEMAEAEKARLLAALQSETGTEGEAEAGAEDSPETTSTGDPSVKIVI